MTSFRGHVSWAKMMSPGGKLTALACHPTKKVNQAEVRTYLYKHWVLHWPKHSFAILSPSTRGGVWTQTLDLGKMRQVFYHFATTTDHWDNNYIKLPQMYTTVPPLLAIEFNHYHKLSQMSTTVLPLLAIEIRTILSCHRCLQLFYHYWPLN